MAAKARSVDAEVDALFQLGLAEFTAARNALASRLKKEGNAIDAERVKSLPKPPAPAWAINQAYWQDPKAVDALLTATSQAGKAQAGKLKNADLRELLAEKKRLVSELMDRVASILRDAGHATTPDTMRRVSATIESLAMSGNVAGAPKPGRLTADLAPPGFDALAAVMGGTKIEAANVLAFRPPAKKVEDPAIARARARDAVQAAEKVLREARRHSSTTATTAEKAAARVAAIEKQKEELEARLADAKAEARKASSEANEAARAVADAEKSLAKAKESLP